MVLKQFCEALANDTLDEEYTKVAEFCLRPFIERAYTQLLDQVQLLIMALENLDFAHLVPQDDFDYPFTLYDSLAAILLHLGVPYHEIETVDAKILLLKIYYALFSETSEGPKAQA